MFVRAVRTQTFLIDTQRFQCPIRISIYLFTQAFGSSPSKRVNANRIHYVYIFIWTKDDEDEVI